MDLAYALEGHECSYACPRCLVEGDVFESTVTHKLNGSNGNYMSARMEDLK